MSDYGIDSTNNSLYEQREMKMEEYYLDFNLPIILHLFIESKLYCN